MDDNIMTLVVFSQIVSGFSTLFIGFLTAFLWWENRLLRKAGFNPSLVAYFEQHPDGTGGLNITIANTGQGPARNVYFQFIFEPENFQKYDVIADCSGKKGPFTLIPQGKQISFLFAVGFNLFKTKDSKSNEPLAPFAIKLEWTDLAGKNRRSENFLLDVKPYAGLPGFISKPYLLKIVDSIDGVGRGISSLNQDVRHLSQLIEATSLDCSDVQKFKGNSESI